MRNIQKILSLIVPVGVIALIGVSLIPSTRQIQNLNSDNKYSEVLHPLTKQLVKEQELKVEQRIRAEKEEQEIQQEIAKVRTFFQSYGAVMTGYEEILVRKSRECGGNYKVLVGIAGNESGLGRIPYKLYNPFGYLDGVQYNSWEEALNKLSCVISQRFIQPCASDLQCIINRYGGPETDQAKWIRNVTWFMNQV